MHKAWSDFIEGMTLLSKGASEYDGPFYCEHDVLMVCADANKFNTEEIARLFELGFHVDEYDQFSLLC